MRRAFATLALLMVWVTGSAQPAEKIHRVGFLSFASFPSRTFEAFRQGLRDLNYVEGRNISILARTADLQRDRLPGVAAELVAAKVDVLVVTTGTAALVARDRTSRLPIVMLSSADAVGMGIVKSLARPGGNVTGLTMSSPDLAAKRLELLASVPGVKRVAAVWCPVAPINHEELKRTSAVAKQLGIQLAPMEYRQGEIRWETLQAKLESVRPQGVFLLDCTYLPFDEIFDYALQRRLPTITPYVGLGDRALLAYGADHIAMARRAARHVDKILRGARPEDLPVEQPTEFELVINRKVARSIGVTLPQSITGRATRIIE